MEVRCCSCGAGAKPDPRSCNPQGISDPQHLSPILVPAQSFPFLVFDGAAGVQGRTKEFSRGQTNWFYFLMALYWCLVGIQQRFPAVTCFLLFYLIAGRERESKEMTGGYWGCLHRSMWECNCFLFAGLYLLVQFEQRELNQRFGLLSTAIWMWYTAGLTVTEDFHRTGDARGKCRSSVKCWPRYCCTNVVPVRLCHEFFSISTKPGAQLHTGNEWEETRRQQWRLSNGCMWQEEKQRREKLLGTRSRQPRGDGTARSVVKLWHFLGFLLGWSHLCWEVEFNSVWWCLNKNCCAISFVSFLFFFPPPFNKWLFVFLADLSAHLSEWVLHLGTAERHWLCSATPENPYMLQRCWAKFHFESCCKCSLPGTKSLPQTVYINSVPWYLGL